MPTSPTMHDQFPLDLPDVQTLLDALTAALRADITADTMLVGIHTGGVWLAQRLHAALDLKTPLGCIDVSYHRDDYANRGSRGLPRGDKASSMPFEVDGAHIIIVDDVLYTGRTVRAAMNELFDYGRPGRIDLAVLIDRGGRELPVCARYCAHTLATPLPSAQVLHLSRTDIGVDDTIVIATTTTTAIDAPLKLTLKEKPDA